MSDVIKPVITISREYGAGGRTIARGLSERLGIPWYDRDFVRLTAKLSGYSNEDIDKEGEQLSDAEEFWDKIANNISAYTSSHDAIYKAQKEAIYELAQEPCIIVGRCSNIVLKEAGIPSFDVFLFADEKIRIERAKNLINSSNENEVKKYVEKKDSLRENHYRVYTGKEMTMSQDYTICIDTGKIDYDTCLDILEQLYRKISE